MAIVDTPLEEYYVELDVSDSIVYIPEEIAIETEEPQDEIAIEENEEVEEEFVEEYIEYEEVEEVVLMAVEEEEIEDAEVFYYADGWDNVSLDEYDSGEAEIVVDTETKDEIEIVEAEETIEEKEEIVAGVPITNGGTRQQLVDYARQWVGVTPYVSWEDRYEDGVVSSSLEDGTDCSGFVSLVYDTFGYQTSAASNDYQEMSNISYDELEPGDVVVYGDGGHVAIYAGDDIVIHCSNPVDGTVESDINYREPTGYVRIIEEDDEYD